MTLLLLRLVLVSSQWQQQRVDSHHDVWAIKHRNGVMVRLENEATFLGTSQNQCHAYRVGQCVVVREARITPARVQM
jgi:hypothetical protein